MSSTMVRWAKRVAVGLAALLLLGFGIGTLAARRVSDQKASPASPSLRSVAGYGGAPGGGGSVSESAKLRAGAQLNAPEAAVTAADATTALPGLGEHIVKNADLSLKIRKGAFDATWERARQIAARLGGYVAAANRGAPQPVPLAEDTSAGARPVSGDLTLRVPATRFEDALKELRALGTVSSDQITSQDVTEEFVDLESRLRNQKAQESVLLRLMAQSKTVGESLSVQQQLSQVQGEIERISGRLNALKKLTELSAITLHLFEPGAAVPGEPEGPSFAKAWRTAIDGLVRMGTVAIIAAIWLLPFAALAGLGYGVWRVRAKPAVSQG